MLFSGAAGCGKTSMARHVAELCESDFIAVFPDSIKEKNEILDLLESLNHDGYDNKGNRIDAVKPSIIFIDEIHRLNMTAQELLGIAMEEYKIPSGTPNKFFWLPYFTIIGATTDDGKLSKPFRDRLKMKFTFEPYSFDDAVKIVLTHANRLEIDITRLAAKNIAKRGRGVPRVLVRYLEQVRDYALSIDAMYIKSGTVETVFHNLGIDENGLTPTDRKILRSLYDAKDAVGLDNLSIVVNEASKTLSQSIEPYLIQKGLIIRSGKGRRITHKGIEYLESSNLTHDKKFRKVEIDANYERT
jgi:Holliday junction DNA helicase RuvB